MNDPRRFRFAPLLLASALAALAGGCAGHSVTADPLAHGPYAIPGRDAAPSEIHSAVSPAMPASAAAPREVGANPTSR